MAIDGLIILDNSGRAILQSGFRSSPPAYPLLHIDAFNTAAQKAPRAGDIDPVLYVYPDSACCHVECGDIRVLCPISKDVDPLYGLSFIQTFLEILQDYFGTVTAGTLTENFDVVYQLLEETLDSGGHPLTTSPNSLRDIVLPPSLLTKLLSVAGANINSSINSIGAAGGGPFSSPIPWRKTGIRYNNNEAYFDVVEELTGIVNKHGATISSNVWGKMDAKSRLSGTPDCLLTFTNPGVLADCAFHPCVRLQRWTRDKALSFVPPDGRFVLFEYRYASPNSRDVPIPFAVKPVIELTESGGTFDITFTSRLSTHSLDAVVVELYLGEDAGSVKCTTGRTGHGFSAASVGDSSSWRFDSRKKTLQWEIAQAPPSSGWSLKGSFTSHVQPRPAHSLRIRFDIPSHTFSALKVDQLKVLGEQYKPYKGVRGRSSGDVEWRW